MSQDNAKLQDKCRLWRLIFATFMLVWLCGCNAAQPDAAKRKDSKHHALTIYGYNYTNRYIDQFYVDGQGGMNLYVSSPTSGGGGGVCCIGWTDGTPLPQTVMVRWVASACMQEVTNSNGRTREVPVHTFKEQEVELRGPVPKDPGYFEVHFYPDGHIEVAITAIPSDPRLRLDKSREAPQDVQYPKCKKAP
jgi:hypothetical protein